MKNEGVYLCAVALVFYLMLSIPPATVAFSLLRPFCFPEWFVYLHVILSKQLGAEWQIDRPLFPRAAHLTNLPFIGHPLNVRDMSVTVLSLRKQAWKGRETCLGIQGPPGGPVAHTCNPNHVQQK